MIQPVLVGPSNPEFVLILNRRLAEISAALEATKTTTDTTTSVATVSSSGGTRKQRLAYPAGKLDTGATWWETDTGLLYVVNTASGEAHKWKYAAGEQRGVLASKPTLDATDTGLLYYATDYARRFRWTGAAWENAPGEMVQGAIAFFEADPGTGWGVADGTGATYSTATAGTTSKTKPNVIGGYLKGSASYAAAQVAATAPAASGGTISSSTTGITMGFPDLNYAETPSGAGSVSGDHHKHPITDPGHNHTISGLTISQPDPAHVNAKPYVRL